MATPVEPPAPPDRPPLPRPGRSWLVTLWAVVVVASVGGYAVAGALGLDFSSTTRDTVPHNVRSSPGGYRTYHFWHSGYHGGK